MHYSSWPRLAGLLALLFVSSCTAKVDVPDEDGGAAFADLDRDGVADSEDNCPAIVNRVQRDTDDDGVGDECDPTPLACDDHGTDVDGDDVCGDEDNCATVANRDQRDQDGDRIGDACDDTPVLVTPPCAGRGGDADGDDVCQATDNCPNAQNAEQRDSDDDGVGDVCDATPRACDDFGGDGDGDTVCSDHDNCAEVSNLNQLDLDSDGIGDVCDPSPPHTGPGACHGKGGDLDNDQWCGVDDNCPNAANPRQDDTDEDGKGDVCDAEICNGDDDDGDGTVDETFADADADSVADCVDVCPEVVNVDTDLDGLLDCVDACPADRENDLDHDSVCGDLDNCPARANANQANVDGDALGDACDVETCDGMDNDGDRIVDEALPDADVDGLCDAVDTCPGDTLNDPERDGVCGLVDNCPFVANAMQEDDDADGSGDACDLDYVCDAPAPTSAPGAVPFPASVQLADIAADPVRSLVYAAVKTTSATYANQVLAIDPATRSVIWAVPVGADPALLEVSHDGSRLYVALAGANAVRMLDLVARRPCRSFAVGTGTFGPRYAGDIAVLPGESKTLVVSTRRRGVSPSFDGVFVFDEGQQRPMGTPGHTGAARIAAATDQIVYGFNDQSTEFGFRRLAINAMGIREDRLHTGFFSSFSNDIEYAGGRIFARSGEVVDPAVPLILGSIPFAGAVAAAPEINRSFTLTSNGIGVADLQAYIAVRTIAYPAGFSGSTHIIRWGTTGLAIMTATSVAFLDGVVVP